MNYFTSAFFIFFTICNFAFSKDASFASYQQILNKHLKSYETGETAFDYASAKKDAQTQTCIKRQIHELENFDLSALINNGEKLAFWLNTYNFTIVRFIVQHYNEDLKSIRDLGSLLTPVWKKSHLIAGQQRSFDDIEHGIVRPLAKKMFQGSKNGLYAARVHFALNCASIGCTPLSKNIYVSSKLNIQLDAATKDALKIDRHLSVSNDKVILSHIFEWFKEDFAHDSGSLKNWLLKWAPESKSKPIQAAKDDSDFSYVDYAWNLNKVTTVSNKQ
ncbi:MAG: DUF547 domain-containing protein [Deltaproteobacteria bacterium]|nr:DUF547 domain-containing protein [Deltaproteobacteria bacterium]